MTQKDNCCSIFILLIMFFTFLFIVSSNVYKITCWKPTNSLLCYNKPTLGKIIQNVVIADNCYNTICYSGYTKISYYTEIKSETERYCFITLFDNELFSNETAYSKFKYNVGQKIYIDSISSTSCNEFTSDMGNEIASISLITFSIIGIFGTSFICFMTVFKTDNNNQRDNRQRNNNNEQRNNYNYSKIEMIGDVNNLV